MPTDILPVGNSRQCAIHADGIITFSQFVIEQIQWQIGQKITVSYLREGALLILLFRTTELEQKGFILSCLNRNSSGGSGGKLRCRHLATTIIRPCVPLPLRNIDPIFLSIDKRSSQKPYQLALILQAPEWLEVEFNANGLQHLPARLTGVYEVVDSDPEKPLKLGEGIIQSRLRENLKVNELRMGRSLFYFSVPKKAHGELIEHIFLMQYKQNNGGKLPPGNRITA